MGKAEWRTDRCRKCYIMLSKHICYNFDIDNSKMIKILGERTRKKKKHLIVIIACISSRPPFWNRAKKSTNHSSERVLVDQVSGQHMQMQKYQSHRMNSKQQKYKDDELGQSFTHWEVGTENMEAVHLNTLQQENNSQSKMVERD